MKTMISLAVWISLVGFASAQTPAVVEQTPVQVQPVQPQVVTSQTVTLPQPQVQPLVVAQPAPVYAAPTYEKQPTTLIEASPLTQSRAEQLRQAREQAEVATEQMIVEKLEQSRLEDERRRAGQLFSALPTQDQVQPAEPQAAPALPPAEVKPGASIDDVRTAVREELADAKKTEPPVAKSYFTGGAGVVDYNYGNIESKMALSVGWGTKVDDRWAMEFGYTYSEAGIDESYWFYRDLIQHGLSVSSKFSFMTGRLQPYAGVGLQYTHRIYSELIDTYNGLVVPSYLGEVASDALDAALVVGLDLGTADRFSVGLEYRYLNNLWYKYDDDRLDTPSYRQSSPLEDSSYDMWGVTVKYVY